MIDFVTVSRDGGRVARLERSLHAALGGSEGVPWKLQVVDGERYDLFEGYNTGAARSCSDILVFLHDDVIVLGNRVALERPLAFLEDAATGFIGTMGATRLNVLGAWWGDLPKAQVLSYCRGAVATPDSGAPNAFGMISQVWPGEIAAYGQVLVVDGTFLMCRRQAFETLGGFDAHTFQGFHFYDVDITLRAHLAGMRNYVAPIPIFHESFGTYDQTWEDQRQKFVQKWAGQLPVALS
jgi:GT2 family glycosyltransferase